MEELFSIKTKRLVIRHLEESDYAAWKEAHLCMLPPQNTWDLAHRKFIFHKKSHFKKMLKDNKKFRLDESFFDYAVFDKKSKKYIGRVSLMNVVRSVTQSAFVGYAIFNNYWGQGYAEEAVNGLIKLAFTKHNLHRVVAGIEPQNKRSLRLAKKLGMRKEGTSKRIVLLRGEWRDLVQFALTSDDRNITWKGKVAVRKT